MRFAVHTPLFSKAAAEQQTHLTSFATENVDEEKICLKLHLPKDYIEIKPFLWDKKYSIFMWENNPNFVAHIILKVKDLDYRVAQIMRLLKRRGFNPVIKHTRIEDSSTGHRIIVLLAEQPNN